MPAVSRVVGGGSEEKEPSTLTQQHEVKKLDSAQGQMKLDGGNVESGKGVIQDSVSLGLGPKEEYRIAMLTRAGLSVRHGHLPPGPEWTMPKIIENVDRKLHNIAGLLTQKETESVVAKVTNEDVARNIVAYAPPECANPEFGFPLAISVAVSRRLYMDGHLSRLLEAVKALSASCIPVCDAAIREALFRPEPDLLLGGVMYLRLSRPSFLACLKNQRIPTLGDALPFWRFSELHSIVEEVTDCIVAGFELSDADVKTCVTVNEDGLEAQSEKLRECLAYSRPCSLGFEFFMCLAVLERFVIPKRLSDAGYKVVGTTEFNDREWCKVAVSVAHLEDGLARKAASSLGWGRGY